MLDTLLQPSAVTRLLHLLQAAQPFLTPSWSRLADMCIRLLNISDLFSHPPKTDFNRILHDIRGCSPSNDMNALLCAIRPFCSQEELQMLQMYEQIKQMQKVMEMWKLFADLMPDETSADSPFNNLSNLFGATGQTGFNNMFSTFTNSRHTVNETEIPSGASAPEPDFDEDRKANPLLAFLSPEQRELYNSILEDNSEP